MKLIFFDLAVFLISFVGLHWQNYVICVLMMTVMIRMICSCLFATWTWYMDNRSRGCLLKEMYVKI